MKKNILAWAIGVLLLCVGCTSETTSPQAESQNLSLSFFEMSIQPLDAKENIPTRAGGDETNKSLKDCSFTNLDIALIPTNANDPIIRFSQNKTDNAENFGSVSMKVPVGTYNMVAVASKTNDIKINSLTEVVFPTKVTDMAYINLPVTVKTGSNSLSCLLKRAVAKFCIKNTGTRGNDVKMINLQLTGNCSNSFNPTTGLAAGTTPLEVSLAPLSKTTEDKYSIYAFLTSNEEKVTAQATIKDGNDNVLKTLSFEQVVLKTNYVTLYQGHMFDLTSTADFTFSNSDFADSGTGKEFDE